MKYTTLKIALISGLFTLSLSGCGSDCSGEILERKADEISEKLEALAATGNMQKMITVGDKAMQIRNAMQNFDDLQEACDAADELLDELD